LFAADLLLGTDHALDLLGCGQWHVFDDPALVLDRADAIGRLVRAEEAHDLPFTKIASGASPVDCCVTTAAVSSTITSPSADKRIPRSSGRHSSDRPSPVAPWREIASWPPDRSGAHD